MTAPAESTILVVEDSTTQRALLGGMLRRFGHAVAAVATGEDALAALRVDRPPRLLLLDWMLPGIEGPEVCERIRQDHAEDPPHIILVTAKGGGENLARGLAAGANDYIVKPFDPVELKARVDLGLRMLALQDSLRRRVRELQAATARIRTLEGLIPICSFCHAIRLDAANWQRLELYLQARTDARFSHGVCPDCARAHYPDHYPPDAAANREEPHGSS